MSASFRKASLGFPQNDLSPGKSFDGSFRKSKSAFQHDDLDASPSQTFEESFRKPKHGVCKGAPRIQSSNKAAPISRRLYTALKHYSRNLTDLELFTQGLEDWILENSLGDSANGDNSLFNSPFHIDELRQLDFALEGVLFQQLFRMPCTFHSSDEMKEEEYYALEDFLHTMADGLWRTFWHKRSIPLPMHVSCARHPRSKFYSLEKAVSRGKLGELSGAGLIANTGTDQRVHWDQVAQFALFKPDIMLGNKLGLSSTALCEALFYGFHILLSRKLSRYCPINSDAIYILVLDSKFGGVVKFGGGLHLLEVNADDPYKVVVDWIKGYSEIRVSPVDRIWNKLGNVNWGDMGALQLLHATFYSIFQFYGPPRKSISSLAADHSLRLQKRRIECHIADDENGDLPSYHPDQYRITSHHQQGEIVELANDHDGDHLALCNAVRSHLNLQEGELIQVDDHHLGQITFQVQYCLTDGKPVCYSAVSVENPDQAFTLYVGAHPSRLEPSWEDMSLWYQVQRQTKVLNVFKQAGISAKHLPQIVSSGKILHPGPCTKQDLGERCDHPWCGTPVLVTSFPVGVPLSLVVSQEGALSSDETIKCCRDCLSALRSAKEANIQHGDICPENIVRVRDLGGSCSAPFGFSYVPISWGRAVLEERDSPAINLLFSSSYSLQHGKLCPSSDVESLVYVLYFLSGGPMQQQDSIESALQWRQKLWAKRVIQRHLGEVSALLKAFADYVDSLCGTPYLVDFDGWLKRLDSAVVELVEGGKMIEHGTMSLRIADVPPPLG